MHPCQPDVVVIDPLQGRPRSTKAPPIWLHPGAPPYPQALVANGKVAGFTEDVPARNFSCWSSKELDVQRSNFVEVDKGDKAEGQVATLLADLQIGETRCEGTGCPGGGVGGVGGRGGGALDVGMRGCLKPSGRREKVAVNRLALTRVCSSQGFSSWAVQSATKVDPKSAPLWTNGPQTSPTSCRAMSV